MLSELNNNRAFTLMELVVAASMISILSAIAVPSIVDKVSHQKIRDAAMDICSSFQQVKLQAVDNNADVIIKFNPASYAPAGGVGTYQVFMDDGSGGGIAGDLTQNGTEPTLRTVAMPQGVSLVSASFTDGTNTYQNAGFDSQGLSAKALSGTVVLESSDRWYQISLSAAGNISMQVSTEDGNWSGNL